MELIWIILGIVSNMKYKKGYKYQLAEPETFLTGILPKYDIELPFIRLTCRGLCTLKEGYAWDGASGAIDTDTNMAASALHDAGCQLVQCKKLSPEWKRQIDMEYYRLCREYGMILMRSVSHFAAIQLHDWSKTPDKPIIEVLPRALRAGKGVE